jgi:hypothetical protein
MAKKQKLTITSSFPSLLYKLDPIFLEREGKCVCVCVCVREREAIGLFDQNEKVSVKKGQKMYKG